MAKLLLILITCFYALSAYAEKRIAIFDYDDRLDKQGTVAKHIEKKLLEMDKSLKISQHSGKENDKIAKKALERLDKEQFDLIITVTSDALLIARHVVKKTPVIFTNANNPLFLGIKSLEKPGKNISGASYYVPVLKQLELFLQIQPDMNTVGGIFDAGNKSRHVEVRESRNAFKKHGLKLIPQIVHSADELPEATKALVAKKVDAILITSSGTLYNNVDKIKAVTDPAKIPIYSYHRKGVPTGAVASLSSDYYLMVDRLVIPMASDVLYQGITPGTMPVRFLNENILSLNLTSAKALGLHIPEELIKSAKNNF